MSATKVNPIKTIKPINHAENPVPLTLLFPLLYQTSMESMFEGLNCAHRADPSLLVLGKLLNRTFKPTTSRAKYGTHVGVQLYAPPPALS